ASSKRSRVAAPRPRFRRGRRDFTPSGHATRSSETRQVSRLVLGPELRSLVSPVRHDVAPAELREARRVAIEDLLRDVLAERMPRPDVGTREDAARRQSDARLGPLERAVPGVAVPDDQRPRGTLDRQRLADAFARQWMTAEQVTAGHVGERAVLLAV